MVPGAHHTLRGPQKYFYFFYYFLKFYLFIYYYYYFFGRTAWLVGSQFPNQGLNRASAVKAQNLND